MIFVHLWLKLSGEAARNSLTAARELSTTTGVTGVTGFTGVTGVTGVTPEHHHRMAKQGYRMDVTVPDIKSYYQFVLHCVFFNVIHT